MLELDRHVVCIYSKEQSCILRSVSKSSETKTKTRKKMKIKRRRERRKILRMELEMAQRKKKNATVWWHSVCYCAGKAPGRALVGARGRLPRPPPPPPTAVLGRPRPHPGPGVRPVLPRRTRAPPPAPRTSLSSAFLRFGFRPSPATGIDRIP